MTSILNYMGSYGRYLRNNYLNDMNPLKNSEVLGSTTTKLQKVVSNVAILAIMLASHSLYTSVRTSFRGNFVPHCALGIAVLVPSFILFNIKKILRNRSREELQKVVSTIALAAFCVATLFAADSVKASLGRDRGTFVVNSCFGLACAALLIRVINDYRKILR